MKNITTADTRSRIAIFTFDDNVWAFPAWKQTIPRLLEKYIVTGICLFPDSVGQIKGIKKYLWYLSVFGAGNFLILCLYALKKRIITIASGTQNWKQLAKQHGLQLFQANTPNSRNVIEWIKNNHIDVIIILVNNILKEKIIRAPNIGIINTHPAMLPSCRGLCPFFWAKLTGNPTGITLHQVAPNIDTGNLLVQLKYPVQQSNISMLRFFNGVYALFPELVTLAVEKLITREYMRPLKNLESSYYSLPSRSDYKTFRKKSFKITEAGDLML